MSAALVVGSALATLVAGCFTPFEFSNDHIVTPKTSQELIDKWTQEKELIDERNHTRSVARELFDRWFIIDKNLDPPGTFKGSFALKQVEGDKATKALSAKAASGTMVGNFSGGFVNARSDAVKLASTTVLTSKKAGSVCLSFSGRSPKGQDGHVVAGTFRVLGGTGALSRLHVSGDFIGIDSNLLAKSGSISLRIALLSDNAKIGKAQPMTSACRAATKPPAPTKIAASLDGYALALPSTRTLPKGTTIYPNNSTIGGSVGCGTADTLYVVVTYQGPKGATFYVNYATDTGGKGGPPPTVLKQGQNGIPLAATPSNGTYYLTQASVAPPPGTTGATGFTGSITLARTC
jgi:hypothetical protein